MREKEEKKKANLWLYLNLYYWVMLFSFWLLLKITNERELYDFLRSEEGKEYFLLRNKFFSFPNLVLYFFLFLLLFFPFSILFLNGIHGFLFPCKHYKKIKEVKIFGKKFELIFTDLIFISMIGLKRGGKNE